MFQTCFVKGLVHFKALVYLQQVWHTYEHTFGLLVLLILWNVAGVRSAYVTTLGRLVGVVGLKELRKAIETSNGGLIPEKKFDEEVGFDEYDDEEEENQDLLNKWSSFTFMIFTKILRFWNIFLLSCACKWFNLKLCIRMIFIQKMSFFCIPIIAWPLENVLFV